jgi:hypothetical protein
MLQNQDRAGLVESICQQLLLNWPSEKTPNYQDNLNLGFGQLRGTAILPFYSLDIQNSMGTQPAKPTVMSAPWKIPLTNVIKNMSIFHTIYTWLIMA